MGTLMAGDYIDDVVNIRSYPHQIPLYHNSLYGDIASDVENYGIIITPDIKYGAIAFWQDAEANGVFNLGYGINLFKFDFGAFSSVVEDRTKLGFGFGRAFFSRRFDCSFIIYDELNYERYQFNLRYSERKADFIIVPKYKLNYYTGFYLPRRRLQSIAELFRNSETENHYPTQRQFKTRIDISIVVF
ncbi:unnamed protein product [marine sediment metagenome]|uniref:Uncharacterized protein n=1 Tax=marine sediment metagenome TaxID=412755 RepID=X1AS95_9ZZZZ